MSRAIITPVTPDPRPETLPSRPDAIRAVLFDLDGTLIDTMAHILASFRHATAVVLGESLPDDVLMHNVGIPLKQQMREFTDDEALADELLAEYRTFNHACHDEMARLYPGTVQMLEDLLGRGVRMGVVTSKGTPMARRGIDLFDLGRFFEVVVTADDVLKHKPDPYPILHAAELLGVAPTECVYVGDSPHDVQAGKAAGAYVVAVTWGVADAARLEEAGPDAVLDDVTLLPALLFGEAR